ncbi:hypothetical protein ACLB1T_12300 [Escherichia coli]
MTGHRRESCVVALKKSATRSADIATTHQDIQIVYPVHLNPNVREPLDRILGHVKNVILNGSPGVFTVCLADEPRLAETLTDSAASGRSAFAGETGAGNRGKLSVRKR